MCCNNASKGNNVIISNPSIYLNFHIIFYYLYLFWTLFIFLRRCRRNANTKIHDLVGNHYRHRRSRLWNKNNRFHVNKRCNTREDPYHCKTDRHGHDLESRRLCRCNVNRWLYGWNKVFWSEFLQKGKREERKESTRWLALWLRDGV